MVTVAEITDVGGYLALAAQVEPWCALTFGDQSKSLGRNYQMAGTRNPLGRLISA
jgi:hypothetical protein